jgi:hypothetical protein
VNLTALVGGVALTDRDHGVGFFDETIDMQPRAAYEVLVLDLVVEGVLARKV